MGSELLPIRAMGGLKNPRDGGTEGRWRWLGGLWATGDGQCLGSGTGTGVKRACAQAGRLDQQRGRKGAGSLDRRGIAGTHATLGGAVDGYFLPCHVKSLYLLFPSNRGMNKL